MNKRHLESGDPKVQQQIRFCTTPDNVRIAYASVGQGPPLVKAAHWLTHVQHDTESPVWRPWIDEFSRHHKYIRYDERGFGLADREVKDFSFSGWVRDLETVVDSAGLEKFDLLGYSQGGPVSIAYASRHPERVSHLILGGTYAKGWKNWNLHKGQLEEIESMLTIMQSGWGRNNPFSRHVFTSAFIPDSTSEQQTWFDELQRTSCTPNIAVQFMHECGEISVQDLLAKVSVPTLILHSRSDIVVPFELGRELAANISNSRFVSLEGKNHILLETEPAWAVFLNEVRSFLEVKSIPTEVPAKAKGLGMTGWLKGPTN